MLKCLVYASVILLLVVSCGSAAQQKYQSHAVQKGETVYSIAKDYGVSESVIYNLNPDTRDELKVNSILIVPSNNVISSGSSDKGFRKHRVKRKETLYSIAKMYNVSMEDIKKLNKELYSRSLRKGELLIIPPTQAATEISDSDTGVLLPGTQKYTVQAKETKFGIARRFGISIAELEDLNPGIKDGLKVGASIVVPEKTKIEEDEIDTEDFTYYEVEPKEGFYRLKVKFGLSKEEIIALNPYAKEGLKDGMVLKLPKNGAVATTEEFSEINLENRINNKKMKTVALMLPLRLERSQGESDEADKDLVQKDPTLRVALDFYSGALMAAEFAKDKGIPVTLNVFDTEKNESKVSSIITNNNLKNADAVIGPLLQKNVEKASRLLKRDNVPVFSPLSNRDMAMSANLFQTLPTNSVLEKIMLQYLATHSFGKNVIVISDSKRAKQSALIKKAIPSAVMVSARGEGYLKESDITGVASEGMENWVILESENPILVSSSVNVLAAMPSNYNMRLFTLDRNEAYEWHEVSSSRLAKLNFTFPSVNRNFSEEDRKPFLTSYKNKYGVLPNRYAIRGFDVTYDILLRLASEKNIYDAILPEKETAYIENKFRYQQSDSEGYCNEAAYILKYNEELKFEVVQ